MADFSTNIFKRTYRCTVDQKRKRKKERKKRNTPIYFNTNDRTEMKLLLIIMD